MLVLHNTCNDFYSLRTAALLFANEFMDNDVFYKRYMICFLSKGLNKRARNKKKI